MNRSDQKIKIYNNHSIYQSDKKTLKFSGISLQAPQVKESALKTFVQHSEASSTAVRTRPEILKTIIQFWMYTPVDTSVRKEQWTHQSGRNNGHICREGTMDTSVGKGSKLKSYPKLRGFLSFLVIFQLHRIVTKFGIPGVLTKAIKSCKIQLNRDAALGVQGVSKNPIVHFINQFPL
jgi:hypothetical protein